MNELYMFSVLDLAILPVWLTIYYFRKDLRHKMIRISLVGALCGTVAEFWYYHDYWHPLFLASYRGISVEDVLFGFLFTGVAATIYDFVFRKRDVPAYKSRKKELLGLFLLGLTVLLFFSTFLKYNSDFVSSFAFLLTGGLMTVMRRDLIKPSAITAVLITALFIIIYVIVFDIFFPGFWNKYWYLAGTNLDVRILGNVPLTELLWYFTIGWLMGAAYNFYKGYKKAEV